MTICVVYTFYVLPFGFFYDPFLTDSMAFLLLCSFYCFIFTSLWEGYANMVENNQNTRYSHHIRWWTEEITFEWSYIVWWWWRWCRRLYWLQLSRYTFNPRILIFEYFSKWEASSCKHRMKSSSREENIKYFERYIVSDSHSLKDSAMKHGNCSKVLTKYTNTFEPPNELLGLYTCFMKYFMPRKHMFLVFVLNLPMKLRRS